MSILRISNLTKVFLGLKALSNLSIEVKSGAITSIIGPNGAGKTTLFNCLTGFITPTKGSIFFKHINITGISPHEVAITGIARTFQNVRLFAEMTVLDNLMTASHSSISYGLYSSLFKTRRFRSQEAKALERVKGYLDMLGLTDYRGSVAGSLPYGMQRRLEIARALAIEPEVLLLDEPSAGMNPSETAELMLIIEKIRSMGKTVIIIEHDMKLVMSLSDWIVVLNYGEKIAEGLPEEIRGNQSVIEAYLGREKTRKNA